MPFSWIFSQAVLFSAAISLFLGFWSLKRRAAGSAPLFFALVMFSNVIYALGYNGEIRASDLETAAAIMAVEYLGVSTMPVFLYLFIREFTKKQRPKDDHKPSLHRTDPLLFLVPALTVILMVTNSWHHLMYLGFEQVPGVSLMVIKAQRGPFYWVFIAYTYILTLTVTARIVVHLFKSTGVFRAQAALVLAGIGITSLSHILMLLRLIPYSVDLTPVAFGFGGILIFWGMFRYRLFDLVPIAREQVMDAIHDGVLVLDSRRRVVDMNCRVKSMFPALEHCHLGESLYRLGTMIPGLPDLLSAPEINATMTQSSPWGDLFYRVKTFRLFPQNHHDHSMVIIFQDFTETSRLMAQLEHQASYDDLTGLINRRNLVSLGEREVRRSLRGSLDLTVCLFDLDHFKTVNDRFGHALGDDVLKAVSQAGGRVFRATDLFSRFGGEEFVVLFPDTPLAEAVHGVERMRAALKDCPILAPDGSCLDCTASFGLTTLAAAVRSLALQGKAQGAPDAQDEATQARILLETCLNRADQAMYQAKHDGRDCIRILE